jgi:hypothetical protein
LAADLDVPHAGLAGRRNSFDEAVPLVAAFFQAGVSGNPEIQPARSGDGHLRCPACPHQNLK